MEYDLEMVVPVSSKYRDRLEDFKRYGVVNVKDRRVLVSLLTSGEKIYGLEDGWPDGVDPKTVFNEGDDYVANVYGYFLGAIPRSRWIMKLDDDSCTDVDGLLENLDKFYDSEERFYLGSSLTRFIGGREGVMGDFYETFFGKIFLKLQHEIECCVLSHVGLEHILSSDQSRKFLENRVGMKGGATDIALAFAAALSKLYPVDLPFSSHFPLLNEFSLFGGSLNHIHLVSRVRAGDNFNEWERCGAVQYEALTKRIENSYSDTERALFGKKFIMETERELRLMEFMENGLVRIKFDDRRYLWCESDGEIKLFCDPRDVYVSLKPGESGSLSGVDIEGRELNFQRVNLV